ncbi:GNAT family N-acetyltransferase [Cryobacterium tepidiphilum]|uniref:GNAT family N-acetyltransferase n=1 Tax=Cryobacterium tepidiphilum TaxID=2486026 RepID=A0A3M8LF16_9MICO|nr:GNAT family N-acetyltransferase [Cryobacterium tepidiphilum]RNE64127.1 GNAT family N-acetyltransferase [Cryobacterium tepidiphilum]
MSVAIRPATDSDRDAIVRVFLACWRESYAAVLPAPLVDGMDEHRATTLWDRVLSESQPGEVLVAEDGAAATGPAAAGELLGVTRFAAPADGEGIVHSLYVAPAAQGRGVGSRLLGAAARALADAGCTRATLWVFRANEPSIGFYRRQGWLPDGRERVQPEFGEPELRLARDLVPGVGQAAGS